MSRIYVTKEPEHVVVYHKFKVFMQETIGKNREFYRIVNAQSAEQATFSALKAEMSTDFRGAKALKFIRTEKVIEPALAPPVLTRSTLQQNDVNIQLRQAAMYPHGKASEMSAGHTFEVLSQSFRRGRITNDYRQYMDNVIWYVAHAGMASQPLNVIAAFLNGADSRYKINGTFSGLPWNGKRLENALYRAFKWTQSDLIAAQTRYVKRKHQI